jgi:general stress protein 26
MTTREQVQREAEPRADRPGMPKEYGIHPPSEGLLPWSAAVDKLEGARNYWVSTTRPDGRPHAMPVWGIWLDGAFYFGTGRRSRKARNLAANPEIVVHLESGDDVVILEGQAEEVTEATDKKRIGEAYAAKYNENADGGASDSPLYAVRPRIAQSWHERDFPQSATRWTFDGR